MTKTSEPHVESENERMGRMMDEADRERAWQIALLGEEIDTIRRSGGSPEMIRGLKKQLRDLEEKPCANN